MNIRPLFLILLFATPAASLTAAPDIPPAKDDPVPIGQLVAPQLLRRGMSRGEVQTLVGAPAQVLPPEVWVYWDFECGLADARAGGFDTLIVKFEDGRVALAKVVSGERLRALLAAAEVPVRRSGRVEVKG